MCIWYQVCISFFIIASCLHSLGDPQGNEVLLISYHKCVHQCMQLKVNAKWEETQYLYLQERIKCFFEFITSFFSLITEFLSDHPAFFFFSSLSVNQFWMLSITGSTKTIYEMIWADVSCSQCSHCFFPALTPYLAGYHAACTTPGYCMCQTSDGSGLCVWQQCFSPGTPPANPHLQGNSEQEI